MSLMTAACAEQAENAVDSDRSGVTGEDSKPGAHATYPSKIVVVGVVVSVVVVVVGVVVGVVISQPWKLPYRNDSVMSLINVATAAQSP
jgi:hypothetical protein